MMKICCAPNDLKVSRNKTRSVCFAFASSQAKRTQGGVTKPPLPGGASQRSKSVAPRLPSVELLALWMVARACRKMNSN